MAPVTFISTCMGRLSHLQQSLPTWLELPDAEIIVVDYSCPDRCGDWVESQHPTVKVLRVPGEATFNVSRARNLGAAQAATEWICFIDADIQLKPAFGAAILQVLRQGAYWRVDGMAELMGTLLIRQRDFNAAGGYDEALTGWGNEDGDLYERLSWSGLERVVIPSDLLEPILHDDQLRVEHYKVKDRGASWLLNRAYLEAKWTFIKLRNRDLSLPERKALYEHVRRVVGEALQQDRAPSLDFCLGWQPMIPGVEIEHRFSFRLRLTHPES